MSCSGFFVQFAEVKSQPLKNFPALIAVGVILLVSIAATLRVDFFERLERMTYDWRTRTALHFPSQVSTNLGFARIDDETIDAVKSGEMGYHFGLYWPRQVYGRLVNELASQGAEAIAFDVLFGELREDHGSVPLSDGNFIESDEYFARELRRAGNAFIAATTNLTPPDLFITNAAGIGDISTDKDSDGILRRAKAFTWHRRWHPMFLEMAAKPGSGVNLRQAKIEPGKITIPLATTAGEELVIELDAENNFTFTPPADDTNAVPQKLKAFTYERVWHMGIALAARHLKLDLDHADIDLDHGRITLRGAGGIKRVIPVDRDGYFLVNWVLRPDDARLTMQPVHSLLRQNRLRTLGEKVEPLVDWRGKLVVIGSSAQGNDLTDLGATPLDKSALLVSKHWNVANSILTGNFIRPASVPNQIILIILLGILTATLSLKMRILPGFAAILCLALIYTTLCIGVFIHQRLWLPMVLPLVGALFVQYALLVTYRALFEQSEQRRVKSVFSKIVAPDVVNELLGAETLSLGGARRELTIMFADIRGFTEMTDKVQQDVADYVRENKLPEREAEVCYDEVAQLTLQTISLYLGIIADTVKQHGGTLDKYIGDCAMAFWGAPKPNPQHALLCIRAAIEAQRGMHRLNETRRVENENLETENKARASAGLPPKPILPLLSLGTGINSGAVMVGLMGSDDHGLNYTVLGREVNLASRLEGVSGRGRIIIGEETFRQLQRDDPALAATCVEQEPTKPKGFLKPVRNFEVPWQT